ncbi:hypothetical protein KM043_005764 [Ampulex compressa]|nr:hypothetical protein KM043_005764 [Ampulex compressa]
MEEEWQLGLIIDDGGVHSWNDADLSIDAPRRNTLRWRVKRLLPTVLADGENKAGGLSRELDSLSAYTSLSRRRYLARVARSYRGYEPPGEDQERASVTESSRDN